MAKKDLFPNQLSGGQQQLVGIARAVVHAPALLLADEPTGNLDSRASAEVLELIDELHASGMTVVLVTHNEDVAQRCARRMHVRDGRVES